MRASFNDNLADIFDLIETYFYNAPTWPIGAERLGHRTYVFYTHNTYLQRLIMLLDLDQQEELYKLVTLNGLLDGIRV